MAVVYMSHPVFGDKVATSDMEAEYDARHGWSRVALIAPLDALPPEDDQAERAEVNNLLAAARTVRRRRLPAQED